MDFFSYWRIHFTIKKRAGLVVRMAKQKKSPRVHQNRLSVKPPRQKVAAIATGDAASKIKYHFPVQPSLKND
jgi:hypothetical protein